MCEQYLHKPAERQTDCYFHIISAKLFGIKIVGGCKNIAEMSGYEAPYRFLRHIKTFGTTIEQCLCQRLRKSEFRTQPHYFLHLSVEVEPHSTYLFVQHRRLVAIALYIMEYERSSVVVDIKMCRTTHPYFAAQLARSMRRCSAFALRTMRLASSTTSRFFVVMLFAIVNHYEFFYLQIYNIKFRLSIHIANKNCKISTLFSPLIRFYIFRHLL